MRSKSSSRHWRARRAAGASTSWRRQRNARDLPARG
jgi:hypothetical protein